jgi:hypothetical protein
MKGKGGHVGSRFPLSSWEVAAASSVLLGFVLGLLGVYLTMPESDYSFLKLPRTLEDLQILRFSFFLLPFMSTFSVAWNCFNFFRIFERDGQIFVLLFT